MSLLGDPTGALGATQQGSTVPGVLVVVQDDSEHLGLATSYAYNITTTAKGGVVVAAGSPFGAMAGLETFSQLVHAPGAAAGTDAGAGAGAGGLVLAARTVVVVDYPEHPHRGLMLDVGRRFMPVPLLETFIKAMACVMHPW